MRESLRALTGWTLAPDTDSVPRHQAVGLAFLRITVGLMWLYNVAWKVPADFGRDSGNGLYKFTGFAVEHPVLPPYSWVVEHLILPNISAFGWLVLVAETALAVLLISGTYVRAAALLGHRAVSGDRALGGVRARGVAVVVLADDRRPRGAAGRVVGPCVQRRRRTQQGRGPRRPAARVGRAGARRGPLQRRGLLRRPAGRSRTGTALHRPLDQPGHLQPAGRAARGARRGGSAAGRSRSRGGGAGRRGTGRRRRPAAAHPDRLHRPAAGRQRHERRLPADPCGRRARGPAACRSDHPVAPSTTRGRHS